MEFISLHKVKNGKMLDEYTFKHQEDILYYLLNKEFSYVAYGPITYIDNKTCKNMKVSGFISNDGRYSWTSQDFLLIRDNKQIIPDDFANRIFLFYKCDKQVSPKDNCWKYGKRLHANDITNQNEQDIFEKEQKEIIAYETDAIKYPLRK